MPTFEAKYPRGGRGGWRGNRGMCALLFDEVFGNDDGEAVRVHLEVAGEGLVATT